MPTFRPSPRALAATCAAAVALAIATSCSSSDPCAANLCAAGETCAATGGAAVCRPTVATPDAGSFDAGLRPGICAPACLSDKPTCDFDTGRCVMCTAAHGCDRLDAPACDTSVPDGRCVGCVHDGDCPGSTCDPTLHACRPAPDAGAPDAGRLDAAPAGACAATLDCDPPCDPGDACMAGVCKPHVACVTECNRGFHCEQGGCVLNGGGGPIQVTLRWSDPEDLDLHLVEPGGCEIYYSHASCVGSLDLDSNAGCSVDNVDIENVIYPAGSTPRSGTYRVRVDYFENCSATRPVPFQVIIRADGNESGFCGVFQPSASDSGRQGSGRTIATFTYP